MCDLITKEEWMRFASPDCPDTLKARILLHAASCAECRSLLEQIRSARTALHVFSDASLSRGTEGGAFRAVASADGPHREHVSGFLSVDFGPVNGALRFDPDSLEDSGCAQKYALNPEQEDTVLADDLGALVLRLEGRELILTLSDGEPDASCRILTDEGDPLVFPLSGTCRQQLPEAGLYTLEITFA